MRQATKEDLKIGNFVMVNYRNPGPPCYSDIQRTFKGDSYTGYYTPTVYYWDEDEVARILPIIQIKKLRPDGERVDFGSWCHYDSLIYLDQNDINDRMEIYRWLAVEKIRKEFEEENPMPIPCDSDRAAQWSYMIKKLVSQELHKIDLDADHMQEKGIVM